MDLDVRIESGNVIGDGCFAKVCLATGRRRTGGRAAAERHTEGEADAAPSHGPRERFAAKLYTFGTYQEQLDLALTEHAHLKQFEHPNVIAAVALLRDDDAKKVCLVLELAAGGDLMAALQPHAGRGMPAEQTRQVLAGVCAGAEYLHAVCGVVHCDLKPENVLLSEAGTPKLCDFDTTIQSGSVTELRGTRDYLAPELLPSPELIAARLAAPNGHSGQNTTVVEPARDIWAIGLIAFIVWTGTFPWERAWGKDVKYNRLSRWRTAGCKGTLVPWSLFGSKLWGVLDQALDPEPPGRPSAQKLIELLEAIDWGAEYRAFRVSWREWTCRHGLDADPTLDPSTDLSDPDDADEDDATMLEAVGVFVSDGAYLGASKVRECFSRCAMQ